MIHKVTFKSNIILLMSVKYHTTDDKLEAKQKHVTTIQWDLKVYIKIELQK